MKSRYASKSAKALLVAPLVLTLATVVHAGDRKVYPGNMAITWSGAAPAFYYGTVSNPSSTSWMYVDLPVINDDTTSGIDISLVKVLDRHYSSDVRCSINTAYWNSSAGSIYGYWGPNKYSSGSSNVEQTLNTGAASHGSTRHEYFSCAIPPTYSGNRSHIISYTVEE